MSTSSKSTSSSSSGCCNILFCDGLSCSHFSEWNINGLNETNTGDCTVYASFDVIDTVQQVEIYSDILRSQLIAVGQRIVALGSGYIGLVAVNSSGVSGSVGWNGNTVISPSFATLACEEFSSSSSYSTGSSQSTLSEYSKSSSSTSSTESSSSSIGCCVNYLCRGTACSYFSSWTLTGTTKNNTDACKLYVIFDYILGQQQVKIYKDSSFAIESLVAIGQGLGTISISSRNGSGIYGTVTWDGITPVYFPTSIVLGCYFYSTSSVSSVSSDSSSTMSFSTSSVSTSSFSTSSSSSSTSSSKSSKSSVSMSSSESSSSSSIDSRSSSSESFENTSTSSVSLIDDWNKTKPLLWGNSAIDALGIHNRLAQTITLSGDTWSLGKAYCYFYGRYGYSSSFNIHLDICECDNEGRPLNIIFSSVIAGSTITGDGWYSFTFNADGSVPSNKYLSFVVWQENGDEDNYVLWGYNPSNDIVSTKAWLSSDNVSWTEQTDIVRAMKLVGNFNAYDLVDFRINTPPAEKQTITHELTGGINDGTKIVKGEYQYSSDKVVIDYPNVMLSFIVDSSGSMGWNDRLNTRKMFISDFIERFKQYYPSDVLVDIVKFGSQVANTSGTPINIGTPQTIKVDLNSPDRTSFVFNVADANVVKNDVYEIDGYSLKVLVTSTNSLTIKLFGDASIPIPDTGTLVLTSGGGDASIPYSSYVKSSLSDIVVAYGFKNLENKHQYYIGDIVVGDSINQSFSATDSVDNWQCLIPNGEASKPLSRDETTGPKNSPTMNFTASDNMTVRYPISSFTLPISRIINDVVVGDTLVEVNDTSWFNIGSQVDLVNRDLVSLNQTVSNVFSNISTIELQTGSVYDIGNWENNGSIIQQSSSNNMFVINGNTAEFLVKDPETNKNITFFIQTFNGLVIEYDFQAYKDWFVYNIYYTDETAILPVSIFDKDGNPFPDGTEIDFYVNNPPTNTSENQSMSSLLTKDALIYDNKLFLDSTTGYKIGDSIDISNNKNLHQSTTVSEVGVLNGSPYINISDVLQNNFMVSDYSMVINAPSIDDSSANVSSQISKTTLLSSSVSLVDVTPIYTGMVLDPSLLSPYDPTPVSPSTTYDELNLDVEHVRTNINDVPTIDGYAVIRVLPITEDNLKTLLEKSRESAREIIPDTNSVYLSQLEQTEGDFNAAMGDISNAVSTTSTTTIMSSSNDYAIDSPVYLSSGFASGSMVTYSTTFVEKEFEGVQVPGVDSLVAKKLLVKEYNIYPAIVITSDTGSLVAKQYLNPFQIYFTPPYTVYTKSISSQISRIIKNSDIEDCPSVFAGYTQTKMSGVYASSGNGITIEYTVMNKGSLSSPNTLRIRVYSNNVIDLAKAMEEGSVLVSRQDLNWVPPQSQSTIGDNTVITQPLSEIDSWRQSVENNPKAELLVSSSNDVNVIGGDAVNDTLDFLSNSGYTSHGSTSESYFSYYTKPEQWTKAFQCGSFQDIEIPIDANGTAILELPSSVSDVEAMLLVQASVYFGTSTADNLSTTFESIRSDIIAIANPIDISPLAPSSKIEALGGNDIYPIGAYVTWEEQPIDDNVIVNFKTQSTPLNISVSKTSNVSGMALAQGIYIGPHDLVYMSCPDDATDPRCQCYGSYEDITIDTSYLNYTRQVTRVLEWTGGYYQDPLETTNFYFEVVFKDSNSSLWSDSKDNYVSLIIDPNADGNMSWALGPHEEGIQRLLGFDQSDDPELFNTYSDPRKAYINTSNNELIIQNNTVSWSTNGTIVNVGGINKNIGVYSGDTIEVNEEVYPYYININVRTSYVVRDGNSRHARLGYGASAQPYTDPNDISDNPALIVPKPTISLTDPLSVKVEIESYKGEFIRNGVDSPNIVATVTWKGAPILNNVPFVNFEAGVCTGKNTTTSSTSSQSVPLDYRGIITDCLTMEHNSEISLSSSSVAVSLSRTDVYSGTLGKHTHSCDVNSSGDGMTTSTIVLDGQVYDHSHSISNYVASTYSEDATFIHSHTLRSVAVTQLNPSTYATSIAINGYAWYDPTSCEPYSYTVTPLPTSITLNSGVVIKRMMFNTLMLENVIKDRTFDLSMTINNGSSSIYTAENVTDTNRGIDIVVHANFSSYSLEDYPGHWIVMPEQPIPDGTRMIFEINTFKPLSATSELVVNPENYREYMNINVKATVFAEGISKSVEKSFTVKTSLQWLPSVMGLLIEPTIDDQYITSALNNIDTLGASQIHDAVYTSAQRLISYQTTNISWKDSKKAIFLLTDGDENTSVNSISQAINHVNLINGKCQVPLMPLKLGYSYGSDEVILKRYADKTCGNNYYFINATEEDSQNLIDDILTGNYININNGVYMNTLDLGQDNIVENIALDNVLLPYGSRVTFRYRFSSDNLNWSAWSDWYDSSVSKDLDLDIKYKGRYFQYQIYLYGNSSFESPEILAGITAAYYKSSSFVIFFKPVDLNINSDEYLSSIHITHKASIPSTSTINYGYSQFDSTNFEDYHGLTRPLITPDRQTIILNRYNEILLTNDDIRYVAINGRWMEGSDIEVYLVSTSIYGELVDPSKYAVNNNDGSITFYNAQNKDSKFVICVYFDPVFRILCNVMNYGPESLVVDHIGIMYNISKRIPTDNNGNIIHSSLSDRI